MLNAITKTKKKAWIIIGVSAALVLASAGVVYMDYTTIGEEEAKTEGLKNENMKANIRISKIRNIEDRVLKERLIVSERVKILPEDKEINDFVQKITDFSTASGVEVTKLDDSAARNRGRRKSAGAFLDIAYKLEVKGTLSQFLDFMHRFETHDRFVKVKQLSISNDQSAMTNEDDEGPAVHQIELILETYVYQPGKKGAAPVAITNADKRTLALTKQGAVIDPLELESYDYESQPERRDIFADPRVKSGVGAELRRVAAKNKEEQEKVLGEVTEEFARLRKALDAEAKLESFVERVTFSSKLNEQLAAFNRKLQEIDDTKAISDRELADKLESDVSKPFALLYRTRKETDSQGMAFQELEAEFKRMERAFAAGQFAEVMAAAKALALVKTEGSGPEMERVFARIDKISARASARQEFSQIPMAVTGYVFQPARPEKAVVIINDRAYSPGDVFAEGVIVGQIDLSRVVFLYKEEKIVRSLD